MRIPILNGVYTDNDSDVRTSYPVNLIPVPGKNGISSGFLRPADGVVTLGAGPGVDRGGINWNGVLYRVMGEYLVKVFEDGAYIEIGSISGTDQATLDYSFDYLSISADNKLWLYDGTTLTQVTDTDLGNVLDHIWVDGYFMTTDGEYLVVTELTDPFSVNPLKYGSSEADPDPIKAILKIRNEPYVLNRHTIEIFDNVGGDLFPFQRIESAQIEKGTIGSNTCCVYMEAIAFLGSGRNEALGIYLGINGTANKISTREIDRILTDYTESQLEDCLLESKVDKGQEHLYIHLPDQTLVYANPASRELGEHVWFILSSSLSETKAQYRAKNFIYCYDKWICGDTSSHNLGYVSDSIGSHHGDSVRWEFGTIMLYNEGRKLIIHQLELIGLTGRNVLGTNPTIWTQYSEDGLSWSMPKTARLGDTGNTNKRIVWFSQGMARNYRIQRFNGTSDAHATFIGLNATIEGLM